MAISVDITVVSEAAPKSSERVMRNLTVVAYNIAEGSIAAYYPRRTWSRSDHYDTKSGTLSYKSTPVLPSTPTRGVAPIGRDRQWQAG